MSRVRAIDAVGDWEFGKGQNDFKTKNDAVSQNIQTRLNSYLGNCFFDVTAGIDWFNLLGAKDQLALNLAVSSIIINTEEVTGNLQILRLLNTERNFLLEYKTQTIYSQVGNTFQYDLGGIG